MGVRRERPRKDSKMRWWGWLEIRMLRRLSRVTCASLMRGGRPGSPREGRRGGEEFGRCQVVGAEAESGGEHSGRQSGAEQEAAAAVAAAVGAGAAGRRGMGDLTWAICGRQTIVECISKKYSRGGVPSSQHPAHVTSPSLIPFPSRRFLSSAHLQASTSRSSYFFSSFASSPSCAAHPRCTTHLRTSGRMTALSSFK